MNSSTNLARNFWTVKKRRIIAIVLAVLLCLGSAFAVLAHKPAANADTAVTVEGINNSNNNKFSNIDLNSYLEYGNSPHTGVSYKDYISENIDKSKSGAEKFEPGTVVLYKQTLFDDSAGLDINSLEDLHYVSQDNLNAEIATYDSYDFVYNLDDNSPYYVGYIQTLQGCLVDVVAANNNSNGEKLADVICDTQNGLIYIAKSYTQGNGEDGKDTVLQTQVQTLVAVVPDSDGKLSNSVFTTIEDTQGNVHQSKVLKLNAEDVCFTIPLNNDLSLDKLKVVANDNVDITSYCYKDEGSIYVNISPSNISTLRIIINDNSIFDNFVSSITGDRKAYAGTANDINCLPYTLSSDRFGGNFTVGSVEDKTDICYYGTDKGTDWFLTHTECLYGPGGFNTDAQVEQVMNFAWNNIGSVDLSNLKNPTSYVVMGVIPDMLYSQMAAENPNGFLGLKCSHCDVGQGKSSTRMCQCKYRIVSVDEENSTLVFAISTQTYWSTTQAGCGLYKVKYESKGGIKMDKTSLCSWSISNPNYSLANCKFNVYTDEKCTQSAGVSITTNADGYAESGLRVLKKGTYYVKEDSSTHGTNYLVNSASKGKVEVSPNTLTKIKWDNSGGTNYSEDKCINTPADDPVTIELNKTDSQTGNTKVPEGYADFSNAQYEYKYYPTLFQNVEDAPSSYERHWIMKTDEVGQVSLTYGEDYKVSGDDFYYSPNTPDPICPIGTYVITEISAPNGYEVSNIVYIENVVSDSSSAYGASSKAYYGEACDTWIKNASGVMEKVHHNASEEIVLGEDELIVDPQSGNPVLKAKEQVTKGDFNFDKQVSIEGSSRERLTRIPFKVTSTTTGEWHVVVTDNNAEVNSANDKCLHRTNTNYFDCLLDSTGSVPSSGIDETVIDNFYDTTGNHAGVWFCWDTKTNKYVAPTEAADTLCAMPYDTYIIEELPVTKNENYILIKQEFAVDTNNYNVDLGTLDNVLKTGVSIETEATNESGEKTLSVSKNALINDRVRYTGLTPNKEYTVKSWAVRADNQKTVSTSVNTKFIPTASNGFVDCRLYVNTLELVGKKISCFEEIYDGNEVLIAQHKTVDDIYQAVTVNTPTIKTNLFEYGSHSKEIEGRSSSTQLQDYIDYIDLNGGDDYTIKGSIVDRATGIVLATGHTKMIADSTGSGTADIYMQVDTTGLSDPAAVVAYEQIYKDDVLICEHKDINDGNQTVTFKTPTCSTTLINTKDSSKVVPRSESVSVTDSIIYDGLAEGVTYSVESKIINKVTGVAILDEVSTQVANSTKQWDIQSSINTLELSADTQLVAYEIISQGGTVVCRHADINDAKQTLTVGECGITTYLHLKDDAAQVIPRTHSVTIVDDIDYYGLQLGTAYTIEGKLLKEDGSPYVDANEKAITYSGSFRPNDTGTTSIAFNFDTSDTPDGTKIISCVYVSLDSKTICTHEDLTDTKETVTVATNTIDISTNARAYLNEGKELYCVDDEGIIDNVAYQGAEEGYEYTLRARVIDKSTLKNYTPVNAITGKDYVEKKFLAKSNGYGSEDIVILLDTRQIQARNIVVYEELYDHMGVLRAAHEDSSDYYQSVETNQPAIQTDLYQKSDSSQVLQRYTEQHLIDKITYQKLAVTHDYVFNGVLMMKSADGTASTYINEVTGLPVTATYTFRPSEADGSFDKLEYVFDSTLLPKDTQLVSYVTVTQADGALIDHCVLDDTRETVQVVTPTIKTKIYDPENEENWFIACRDKTIADDYTWTNLPKDRVVQVYSWLVNHDTGMPVTDGQITDDEALEVIDEYVSAFGGRLVQENNADYPSRWCVLFTDIATKVDTDKLATIDIKKLSHIAFTSNDLAINEASGVDAILTSFNYGITPAQTAVAMSVIVSENAVMASHTDIEDADEAIEILRSEIGTALTDTDGNKEVACNQNLMLVDTIDYKNLIVGKEYELSGSLVNKADESVVATNKVKFICDSKDGQTTISFNIDANNYAGWDLVAFEELYLDSDLACEHKDIDDAGQTIHVKTALISMLTGSGVKTGDTVMLWILIALMLTIAALCCLAHYEKKKEKRSWKRAIENNKQGVSEMVEGKHVKIDISELQHADAKEEVFEEEISLNDKKDE